MKGITYLFAILLALLLATSSYAAGEWESDADDGTGTELTDDYRLGRNGVNVVYYFIGQGTSADSDLLFIPAGMTGTVTFNADITAATATDLTVRVMRRQSYVTAKSVNHSFIVENKTLTGVGTLVTIWELPYGHYWIDVVTSDSDDDGYVMIEKGVGTR